MLHRLETLAVQAANGTYSTLARENIEAERAQLLDEIDRIGQATDFNSISMFDSEDPPVPIMPPQIKDDITLQIGHSVDETLDMRRYYVSSKALLLDRTDFTTVDKANASTDIIRDAVQAISQIRSSFGSVQSHLEHTHNNLSVTEENMTAAESKIRDTDMADEFTTYTKENIMFQRARPCPPRPTQYLREFWICFRIRVKIWTNIKIKPYVKKKNADKNIM